MTKWIKTEINYGVVQLFGGCVVNSLYYYSVFFKQVEYNCSIYIVEDNFLVFCHYGNSLSLFLLCILVPTIKNILL